MRDIEELKKDEYIDPMKREDEIGENFINEDDLSDGEDYYTEITDLNSALDEINKFMDKIEVKSEKLLSDLKKLLEENKDTRVELQNNINNEKNCENINK